MGAKKNMTHIETILDILTAHGITNYTETTVNTFITEAKLLVNTPHLNDAIFEEYKQNFTGDSLVTMHYPIKRICELKINGKTITPERVDEDGIIYLEHSHTGKLEIRYIVGLTDEDMNNLMIPLVVALIENREGRNVSSVTEGDVSVSYNNSSGMNSLTIDSLVNELRERYGSRVVLL